MQVNDNLLNFEDLLEQVLNGVFQMNLPASFKKVVIPSNKTAAIDEFKQAAAGNDEVGNGDNKKTKDRPTQLRNSPQPNYGTILLYHTCKKTQTATINHQAAR